MEGRPTQSAHTSPTGTFAKDPVGGFVSLDGETYYRIAAYQQLDPFLMSLASDTDLWMFVTSGGGLTAGRVDAEGSLFPYRTVDQLHEAHHHSGPLTLIQVERLNGIQVLWEPFLAANRNNQGIERNLYKNTTGNRLVFEEINHELDLAFRYRWSGCDEFGWVRTATLENRGGESIRATVLDGLRNILPHGASLALYQTSSNLVDAYKRSDVDPETGLGIFSLTAGITDRAEAIEVLQANTVWCCGLEGFKVHLSCKAVAAFRQHRVLSQDLVQEGGRGNYLISSTLDLDPGESSRWHMAADVGLDHVQIAKLRLRLQEDTELMDRIDESLDLAQNHLQSLVGSADGIQLTGLTGSDSHHFANVLFNVMRGGVFLHGYDIPLGDFADFLRGRDAGVAIRMEPSLEGLPDIISVDQLNSLAQETGDADFQRLCYEYLPLYFGRRHGDPSRPWNKFSISSRDKDGELMLNYEGNWRDIFQNWEALGQAFPGFLPNFVAKFVNASTVDGFNPYRLNRDGVAWETVEPEDPWANIGYWGDHQIIYLLKLLEGTQGHDPQVLDSMLGKQIFSYAEVPYLIKPYEDILQDPAETITFDDERAARIEQRVEKRGTDGKLLTAADGSVYHANLFEKLLVPALSKVANLIPEAGIWMNTQRPEWNDANNALAGGGVSVVTLCYLRRYLAFLLNILDQTDETALPVSTEVVQWFEKTASILDQERETLADNSISPIERKRVMDALGGAFSSYRETVYAAGFSGKTELPVGQVSDFCHTALEYVDRGIQANRRSDGLFHTYNFLAATDNGTGIEVTHLQEMLEGQVAVLSSGVLDPEEALVILEKLFASPLYRPDQKSFMLYPQRKLPGFLEKNLVPAARAEAIGLLNELMVAKDESVIVRDALGVCRFSGEFRHAGDLNAALDSLESEERWSAAVARDREAILDLFEEVFRHKSYTGRSGFMYGYEGLGCIYWHMVAKLLLAVQEVVLEAQQDSSPASVQDDLAQMYYRIREGLGYEKTVSEYGAFPTDPYSHTPPNGGAKQPGMTGQVKEEILTRMGELGVRIEEGTLGFRPLLLDQDSFPEKAGSFRFWDVNGQEQALDLPSGSLAFTCCQVPVIYEKVSGDLWTRITFSDGQQLELPGSLLDAQLAGELFHRSGRIKRLHVGIPG